MKRVDIAILAASVKDFMYFLDHYTNIKNQKSLRTKVQSPHNPNLTYHSIIDGDEMRGYKFDMFIMTPSFQEMILYDNEKAKLTLDFMKSTLTSPTPQPDIQPMTLREFCERMEGIFKPKPS